MNEMYARIDAKLARDKIVILDGGTGSEIQRQGAPMSGEVWCAIVTRSHPQIVRKTHELYIDAGADVITANTFATSPLMLAAHGLEDDMEDLDRQAISLALEARDAAGKAVCVAASMSAMLPVVPGTDRPDPDWSRPEAGAREAFRRKAHNMAEAGAELFIMEMMRDTTTALWSCEAALETGLPIWLGLSCRARESDGALVGYNRENILLSDVYDLLVKIEPQAINIMHTSINDTDAALDLVRSRWSGTLGAYPEAGYFTIPDWVFGDITPEDFVDVARGWLGKGVQIIGGCCGMTPEHIAALSAQFGEQS